MKIFIKQRSQRITTRLMLGTVIVYAYTKFLDLFHSCLHVTGCCHHSYEVPLLRDQSHALSEMKPESSA
jgi:hypothetical protein